MVLKKLKNIALRHLPTMVRVEVARRFPSTYSYVKVKPSSAWLNVTDNCNMRCIMCNQWKENKTGELTIEEWKGILSQLSDLKIREICFGGGEPLLIRDLPELIRYGRELGMAMGITTSGYLLTEHKLNELLDAGISNVTISIDGVGEDYEKIRRREWNNVLRGAELLAKAKKEKGLQVILGFVLMKPTLTHFPAVRDLAKRLNFPIVVSLIDTTPFLFQLPENSNENVNWIGPSALPELSGVQNDLISFKESGVDNVYNSFSDINFFSSYFQDPLQKSIPCTVAQMRIMINGMGDVYGGCWSMGTFGNLREKSLKEIVESPRYQKVHQQMFYKKCPGCSCGYATSNRYYLPMQLKEVVFRLFPSMRRKVISPAPVKFQNGAPAQAREEAKVLVESDNRNGTLVP